MRHFIERFITAHALNQQRLVDATTKGTVVGIARVAYRGTIYYLINNSKMWILQFKTTSGTVHNIQDTTVISEALDLESFTRAGVKLEDGLPVVSYNPMTVDVHNLSLDGIDQQYQHIHNQDGHHPFAIYIPEDILEGLTYENLDDRLVLSHRDANIRRVVFEAEYDHVANKIYTYTPAVVYRIFRLIMDAQQRGLNQRLAVVAHAAGRVNSLDIANFQREYAELRNLKAEYENFMNRLQRSLV